MITPVVVVTESANRKVAGGIASGNRRRPDPGENLLCTVRGTKRVAYGADGRYVYKIA
jgi:hypothetical protein